MPIHDGLLEILDEYVTSNASLLHFRVDDDGNMTVSQELQDWYARDFGTATPPPGAMFATAFMALLVTAITTQLAAVVRHGALGNAGRASTTAKETWQRYEDRQSQHAHFPAAFDLPVNVIEMFGHDGTMVGNRGMDNLGMGVSQYTFNRNEFERSWRHYEQHVGPEVLLQYNEIHASEEDSIPELFLLDYGAILFSDDLVEHRTRWITLAYNASGTSRDDRITMTAELAPPLRYSGGLTEADGANPSRFGPHLYIGDDEDGAPPGPFEGVGLSINPLRGALQVDPRYPRTYLYDQATGTMEQPRLVRRQNAAAANPSLAGTKPRPKRMKETDLPNDGEKEHKWALWITPRTIDGARVGGKTPVVIDRGDTARALRLCRFDVAPEFKPRLPQTGVHRVRFRRVARTPPVAGSDSDTTSTTSRTSALAPRGSKGALPPTFYFRAHYRDLSQTPVDTSYTEYSWERFAAHGQSHESIPVLWPDLWDEDGTNFRTEYDLYDWSAFRTPHQLNADALVSLAEDLRARPPDLSNSAGASLDVVRTRALFTRMAFIMNTLGFTAWDAVKHASLVSIHRDRARFYFNSILQGDTRLPHQWKTLVSYLREGLSRHGHHYAEYDTLVDFDPNPDSDESIAYIWFGRKTSVHAQYLTTSPRRGLGFSRQDHSTRPSSGPVPSNSTRLIPNRPRTFAAVHVFNRAHESVSKVEKTARIRVARLPPDAISSSRPLTTPVERSYQTALRVRTARMLGWLGDIVSPNDIPTAEDTAIGRRIAQLTKPDRTMKQRIADGRICVSVRLGSYAPGRKVGPSVKTLALVDTGAAADVIDGDLAARIEGLRYSRAPPVQLTGFGDDMTAYARIAYMAVMIGPVRSVREVLVVDKGLMGSTQMLLGLATLIAMNAHISLDPTNWGMTITAPDADNGERYHVPFCLRTRPTGAFWSASPKMSPSGQAKLSFAVTSRRALKTRLTMRRRCSSRRRRTLLETTTEPTTPVKEMKPRHLVP
eukprot:tig00020952_g16470.t1